jgi:hypothetical protein
MTIFGQRFFTCPLFLRGMAFALGMAASSRADDFLYTFNSEPAGLVSGSGAAAGGTTLTTPTPNREANGQRFSYWKVNGVRQADATGMALLTVQFVLNSTTTATAVYIATSDDVDGDGLADWWEWQQFGNLDQTPTGDTDGDGFNQAVEYWRGYAPRLADAVIDGGVSSRRSDRLTYVAASSATYVFNSDPVGLVNQSGAAALGTTLTTPSMSIAVSDRTFAYWQVNGVRQADANGIAMLSVTFTLNGPTTATAVYTLTSEDADQDGLPDWWERRQFGNLDQPATGDPDGDGFRNSEEYWRGTSPRLVDAVIDGGVAARRSEKLSFVAPTGTTYVFNSEPAGLVNQSGAAAVGTTITTPSVNEVSGQMFAYWKVNGVRQADPQGIALRSVAITLSGPTTATAVYIPTDEDTDGDGLPDWWEWQQFGQLGNAPSGDTDADGFNHQAELNRGYSPHLVDTIVDGGVAARRSTRFVYLAISITAQSAASQVTTGGALVLSVTAESPEPILYQWLKDGVAISGANGPTYRIAPTTAADGGVYTVSVGNTVGAIASSPIPVTVVPATMEASHELRSAGYVAGNNVTILNTLAYTGTPSALDWQVLLPENWRFMGESGSLAQTKPTVDATGLLTWEWTTLPPSPIVFAYTVSVPAGEAGTREIAALTNIQLTESTVRLLAHPDPLVLRPASSVHSVDTNGDGRIALFELTRIIELYNTRNGTVRTGSYTVQVGSEDGFAPDPARTSGTPATLSRYHSADTSRDGTIGLFELTRVIELYNYRSGTVRTGEYHAQSGTEDGFAPGP